MRWHLQHARPVGEPTSFTGIITIAGIGHEANWHLHDDVFGGWLRLSSPEGRLALWTSVDSTAIDSERHGHANGRRTATARLVLL